MYTIEKEGKREGWGGRYWASGGCLVLGLTLTFIAVALYTVGGSVGGFSQSEVATKTGRQTTGDKTDRIQPAPPPNSQVGRKAVIEMVSMEEAKTRISPKFVKIPIDKETIGKEAEEVNEDFRVPQVNREPLHTLPAPAQIEESGNPAREGASKKRAEALFPSWSDLEPMIVDPNGDRKGESLFSLPGFRRIPEDYYYEQGREDESSDEEEGEEDLETLEILSFLRKRLKEAYDWVSTGEPVGKDWMDVLEAVNSSLLNGNVSGVVSKLREAYGRDGGSQTPSSSSLIYPEANASNIVSFGLLAIDLFLLHNVQQMAIGESPGLSSDPDVLAMNALFLDPKKVKLSFETGGRSLMTDQRKTPKEKGVLEELGDFLSSGLRAASNLGKAYKETVKEAAATSDSSSRSFKPTTLDCLWTIYCRNLDKTAKISGPYGLLAKINSLGLRLMMGEFPIEKAIEKLVREVTTGWSNLNCQKLFPRCSADEAKQVVLKTALGENLV